MRTLTVSTLPPEPLEHLYRLLLGFYLLILSSSLQPILLTFNTSLLYNFNNQQPSLHFLKMKLSSFIFALTDSIALSTASTIPTAPSDADPVICGEGQLQCTILPLILLKRHATQRCHNNAWHTVSVCGPEHNCDSNPSLHCVPKQPALARRDCVDGQQQCGFWIYEGRTFPVVQTCAANSWGSDIVCGWWQEGEICDPNPSPHCVVPGKEPAPVRRDCIDGQERCGFLHMLGQDWPLIQRCDRNVWLDSRTCEHGDDICDPNPSPHCVHEPLEVTARDCGEGQLRCANIPQIHRDIVQRCNGHAWQNIGAPCAADEVCNKDPSPHCVRPGLDSAAEVAAEVDGLEDMVLTTAYSSAIQDA
jgi:hypothetical protein